MTINLSAYNTIKTNLFVRIKVGKYESSAGTENDKVLTFSDYHVPYDINGETYYGLGKLLGVSTSTSELRPSSGEFTVTISGIPNSSITEVLNSSFRGSAIWIYRAMFDPVTNNMIATTGNPMAKFRGFINNVSLQEDFDNVSGKSSNTILLVCNSAIDVLTNKVAGRKTNSQSNKKFYSSDICMDRVTTLENAAFDFGKPK